MVTRNFLLYAYPKLIFGQAKVRICLYIHSINSYKYNFFSVIIEVNVTGSIITSTLLPVSATTQLTTVFRSQWRKKSRGRDGRWTL